MALADALGNLVRFSLPPGQRHGSVGAAPLTERPGFEALLGDKAFGADWPGDAVAVIPSKDGCVEPVPHDE